MIQLAEFLEKVLPVCWRGKWLSVDEMAMLTGSDMRSVRWCIRQLQTGKEGNFLVRKRKREPTHDVTEIYIKRKPAQMRFKYE
jgi:hypothetical protein